MTHTDCFVRTLAGAQVEACGFEAADTEPPMVALAVVPNGPGSVAITLTPDEAKQVAAILIAQADRAEGN